MQCLLEKGRERARHSGVSNGSKTTGGGRGGLHSDGARAGTPSTDDKKRLRKKKLKTAKKAHNFLMRIYFVRQANDTPRALRERERGREVGEGGR